MHHHLLTNVLRAEIQRIVADAAARRRFLRAGEHAYRLSRQFPNSGVPDTELVNEIVAEAARAGVAVEIYQPSAEGAA